MCIGFNVKYSSYWLFQVTNLMHNSFILQQYVCYITILNMFRAVPCSSSGGQIVLLEPLVSSPSVNSRTVCRLRADWHVEDRNVTYILLKNKGTVHQVGNLKKSILWCTVRKASNYSNYCQILTKLEFSRKILEEICYQISWKSNQCEPPSCSTRKTDWQTGGWTDGQTWRNY